MTSRRRLAVVGALAVALVGGVSCSPPAADQDPSDRAETTPSATPRPSGSQPPRPAKPQQASACPPQAGGGGVGRIADRAASGRTASGRTASGLAAADPEPISRTRPVVRLCFDVPPHRKYVQGHETVTYTPDQRTCEAVFRSWPNKPETARAGNRLDISGVAVDGRPVTPEIEAAGAPKGWPGTLVRVPLPDCRKAGQEVSIELGFTLTVGPDTPERVGYSRGDRTLWLGTAYPLLAWQRGRDWASEPAVKLFGESVASESFRLAKLEVITPRGDEVAGTGRWLGSAPGPRPGTRVHRFAAKTVRDVAISVGSFEVVEQTVDGVRLHVVGPKAGTQAPLQRWSTQTGRAVRELSAYFGDFPYADLWITVAPDVPTGIEFPGAIQFGDLDPLRYPELVPHEVAHQWFYGLVGNNQGRHPWLDESFANYAESLLDGSGEQRSTAGTPARVRGLVGESMRWYARLDDPRLYTAGVYQQGGSMLHQARRAVGPKRWDRLLRAYIRDQSHQIATPADVARAFGSEPEALEILRRYGAIE